MNTAVITTGGLGTRMLTFTKSNPKTMLPIYSKSNDSSSIPIIKPLLEYIFDNLYDYGFRRFCIIVGSKTKSVIINHLEEDSKIIKLFESRNTPEDKRFKNVLLKSYSKMKNCEIKWISQDTPSGFGDALLGAKKFVKNETFLLHAGDAYFPNYQFLKKIVSMHENSNNSSASILTKKMKQLKGYGIAQTKKQKGENIVINLEEKPKKPKSDQAILPLYIFKSEIFDALKNTDRGYNNELQITDAIMTLVKNKKKVLNYNYGINKWFDIGTPNHYFNALTYSYKQTLVLLKK
jgi:UTP--glucose-1-phosphate uridylyltransferase